MNTGVGSLFPSPGDLPDPGILLGFPVLQADSLPAELPGKLIYMCVCLCVCIYIHVCVYIYIKFIFDI